MPDTKRLWSHEVVAHNTATASDNRIHADDVAKQFGFAGGLVPGVDVWAYMTRPCIDRWGPAFLDHGVMEARFHAPLYDGERATAALTDGGILELIGPDDTVRASGTAAIVETHHEAPEIEVREPTEREPASAAALETGTVLGTLRFELDQHRAKHYLDSIREDHPIYEDGAVAHPAFWARQCNYVLSRHVVLGPWIHVGTVARHRGIARAGDQIEVRGVVHAEREHRGHRFVDLDVTVTANGALVFDAFHTAIWRPRGIA